MLHLLYLWRPATPPRLLLFLLLHVLWLLTSFQILPLLNNACCSVLSLHKVCRLLTLYIRDKLACMYFNHLALP